MVVDANFARQLETEIHHWRDDYRKLITLHNDRIGEVAKEISGLKLKLLYHGIAH